jgi:hypothetical protein
VLDETVLPGQFAKDARQLARNNGMYRVCFPWSDTAETDTKAQQSPALSSRRQRF